MRGTSISDGILVVLLHATEAGRAVVSTAEVAHHVGIEFQSMVHVLPVLIQRGHLDPMAGSGMLKLSEDGLAAARGLVR